MNDDIPNGDAPEPAQPKPDQSKPSQQEPAQPGPAQPESTRSVIDLIRALQSGEVKGTALSTPDRRRIVDHLWLEGCSVPETADIIKISERTIQRDRAAIRATHALERRPELVNEVAGALCWHAEAVTARLRRISKDRDTPPAVRVEAERAIWNVHKEHTQLLQSLGHLPREATNIQAELTVLPSFDDMRGDLGVFEEILRQTGADPAVLDQLATARADLERAAAAHTIKQLVDNSKKEEHRDI